MRSQWTLAGWLSLTALLVLAGSARAEVVFPRPTVDLGQIRTGPMLEHQFTFVNQGPGTAEITAAKASCGCLNPIVDRPLVKAGEAGTLQLKINTLSAPPGLHTWQVQVRYRQAGTEHEAVLALYADVQQEIIVQPPALIVYADGPVEHQLTVTDLRPQPFHIRAVEATSPHVQARVVEEQRNAQGHHVRKIDLLIAGDLAPGRHDVQVAIYTDDPDYREIRVPLAVLKRARQRLCATPASVALVASAGQLTPSRLVTLRDSEGELLTIERVTAADPAIACEWSQGESKVGSVKITVHRARMRGEQLSGQVQVFFKQPTGASVTIPVMCTVR